MLFGTRILPRSFGPGTSRRGEVSTATFRKVRVNGVGKKSGGESVKNSNQK